MKPIVNERMGIKKDTFFKDLIEIINDVYVDNLPFELEIYKIV